MPDSDARPPRRAPGSRAPEQDRAADNPWRTEGLPRSGDGKGRGPRNPGRARLWTAVLVGYLVVFGLLTLQRGRDPARQ